MSVSLCEEGSLIQSKHAFSVLIGTQLLTSWRHPTGPKHCILKKGHRNARDRPLTRCLGCCSPTPLRAQKHFLNSSQPQNTLRCPREAALPAEAGFPLPSRFSPTHSVLPAFQSCRHTKPSSRGCCAYLLPANSSTFAPLSPLPRSSRTTSWMMSDPMKAYSSVGNRGSFR